MYVASATGIEMELKKKKKNASPSELEITGVSTGARRHFNVIMRMDPGEIQNSLRNRTNPLQMWYGPRAGQLVPVSVFPRDNSFADIPCRVVRVNC